MELIEYRRRIISNGPHINKSKGDILTFNTDIIKQLKVCKVNFDPIQSGTGDPSPNNIRPIIGRTGIKLNRTGRNIFDFANSEFANREYYNANGAITSSNLYRRLVNYIEVKPNKTYTVQYTKSGSSSTGFTVPLYDENKNFIQRETPISAGSTKGLKTGQFTTTSATKYIRFSIINVTEDAETVQIEEGNTAHDFEPFGNLYEVTFPDGDTVYGGTLDMLTGELVVDSKIIEITSIAVSEAAYGVKKAGEKGSTTRRAEVLCNCLTVQPEGSLSDMPDNSIMLYESNARGYDAFGIKINGTPVGDNQSQRVASVNAELDKLNQVGTPLTVVFYLVEPIRYQLTPQQIITLKGINNIWADTEKTHIAYWSH